MIPDDSRYCDMCGVELLECVKCGTLGTDPFCPECGSPMISRKPGKKEETGSAPAPGGDTTVGRRKVLKLKSRKGAVTITPADEAVIGRKESPYQDALADFGLISRCHGKFLRRGRDWYIVDFGSTNGTYVNDREVPANTPVKFAAGDVVDIGTYIFDAVEE
ncbi:MAG: FHA domain-containing protein [Muribaculaceae bacterium]|nr:FHA domain-containing protein [Muribaculaceae bacterium]